MTKDEFINSNSIEVKFLGEIYILATKTAGETDCPLATVSQYENGDISFAHIQPDGDIERYREKIGTIGDLIPTGKRYSGSPNLPNALFKTMDNIMDQIDKLGK